MRIEDRGSRVGDFRPPKKLVFRSVSQKHFHIFEESGPRIVAFRNQHQRHAWWPKSHDLIITQALVDILLVSLS